MSYVAFTEEQRETARRTDIAALLLRQGEKLKKSGSEYEWLNGGQKVTIRGNVWYHQYEQHGGDAVDFVQKFYGMSYQEAVAYLNYDCSGTPLSKLNVAIKKERELVLPDKNDNMRRVYAYLLNTRKIDKEILSAFIYRKMIYESSPHHNAVFVGYDAGGVPRHASKRSTGKWKTYKGNATGSSPEYSFHWHGTSSKLFLFEAPIDMLSYISLHKTQWKQDSYAACCGVGDSVVFQMLKDNPNLKTVFLCLDHDEAGRIATERIAEKLNNHDIETEVLVPVNKDWNEDLINLYIEDSQEEAACQGLCL